MRAKSWVASRKTSFVHFLSNDLIQFSWPHESSSGSLYRFFRQPDIIGPPNHPIQGIGLLTDFDKQRTMKAYLFFIQLISFGWVGLMYIMELTRGLAVPGIDIFFIQFITISVLFKTRRLTM